METLRRIDRVEALPKSVKGAGGSKGGAFRAGGNGGWACPQGRGGSLGATGAGSGQGAGPGERHSHSGVGEAWFRIISSVQTTSDLFRFVIRPLYSVLPFQHYKDTNNSSGDQLSGKKNKKKEKACLYAYLCLSLGMIMKDIKTIVKNLEQVRDLLDQHLDSEGMDFEYMQQRVEDMIQEFEEVGSLED